MLAKSFALALLNDINAITKITLLEDDIAGLEMLLPKPAKPEPNRRAKTELILGRAGNFG